MKLCISMTCFNNYFKSRIDVFFVVHNTKNYAQTFKEELNHALTVDKTISTSELSTNLLDSRESFSFHPGDRTQNNRPDIVIPLSTERLDLSAYTFTYHMEYGCALQKDPFWRNINVRELLLKYRIEEHSASHSMSCFIKGRECGFLFPFVSANCTYIHEDRGEKNEKKHCGIY
jgi:hypothetical protein